MTPDELEVAWEVLDEREKIILTMRFGLDDKKPMTLEAVGKHFTTHSTGNPMSKERVRQLQNIALSKLQRAGHQLDEYGKIVLPTPKILAPKIQTVNGAKPKRRKKKLKPKVPVRSDSERLDWLEEAINDTDMKISASAFGSMTLYKDGKGESWGKDLRNLIDTVMEKNK